MNFPKQNAKWGQVMNFPKQNGDTKCGHKMGTGYEFPDLNFPTAGKMGTGYEFPDLNFPTAGGYKCKMGKMGTKMGTQNGDRL
jgi:hypothetical protein